MGGSGSGAKGKVALRGGEGWERYRDSKMKGRSGEVMWRSSVGADGLRKGGGKCVGGERRGILRGTVEAWMGE